MKAEILDLMEQRCPLSLLLVKRKMATLSSGMGLTILLTERASVNDIQLFLSNHSHPYQCKHINDTYQLDVIKGPN